MSNVQFIARVANEERVHRMLHGVKHAEPYLEVLRRAAQVAATNGIFDDVTFTKHGLAEGGPFVKH